MEISKKDLTEAAFKVGIPDNKVEALWTMMEEERQTTSISFFSKFMFYFGGLMIIPSILWFINLIQDSYGSGGAFGLSTAFFFFFLLMAIRFRNRMHLRLPCEIFVILAILMIPIGLFALGHYLILDIYRTYSFVIEFATMLASAIAYIFFPFPILIAIFFFAASAFSLDFSDIYNNSLQGSGPWIFGGFGLLFIVCAFFIHLNKSKNYAFWPYLIGTCNFWFVLNILTWETKDVFPFFYLLINLAMIFISILIGTKILVIFGGVGIYIYLFYLAEKFFGDSIFFPFAVSFLGLILIYLGVKYQKNSSWIEKRIKEKIPQGLRNFLPSERD